MSDNYEALPCAGCGGEPRLRHEPDDDGGTDYLLECPRGCGPVGVGPTEDRAIQDWNFEQEDRVEPIAEPKP